MSSKALYFLSLLVVVFLACSKKGNLQNQEPGLIGIYYSEPNLTSIKGISVLNYLDQKWDDSVDYEGDTSGEWNGYIIAPASGKIDFYLTSNRILKLKIDTNHEVSLNKGEEESTLSIDMKKGQSYPMTITFLNPGKHEDIGWFHIQWGWNAIKKKSITPDYLYHTSKEAEPLDFLSLPENKEVDTSAFIYAVAEHKIIYYEKGRFGAWPANGGIWNWGNEIVVAFTRAWYKANKYHHAIDRNKPISTVLARSMDGGEHWSLEDTTAFSLTGNKIQLNKQKIDFSAEGFALRNTNDIFYYSYDRGKNWKGPFQYPDFGLEQLTSRTDYLVRNSDECLLFLSAKDQHVQASLQDKAMVVKTTDGGLNFEFISWMSEKDSIRAVMPATVRIDENRLVTALRRRLDPPGHIKYALPQNWIDVYRSDNNGKVWSFLHKIANTDTGIRNGNPPSMVKLKNGDLCVIYGYRGFPYGIRAKLSKDNGTTWSKEIIVRDDANSWDLGYLRSVIRADGKIVSVYYYATKERPERHIAASIWDPNEIDFFNN